MAEEDKRDEKFDFNAEGDALGYISLDQARVQAIEHARNNTGVGPVWEVSTAHQRDDYYDIRLSFRPFRSFRGEPGVERFVLEKMVICGCARYWTSLQGLNHQEDGASR